MIEVREAVAADAPALAELRWEFRAGREAPAETHDGFVDRCAEWMRRELSTSESWRAWVAVRDSRIVGQIWLNLLRKIPNPVAERERHAYVSSFYVQPAERGGVGARMLDVALAWAEANGVDRVVLWPSARSVTLYERWGFEKNGEVMVRKCGAAPRG